MENLKDKQKCEICDGSFCYKRNLKKHVAIVHNYRVTNKDLKCGSCEKSFKLSDRLRKHIKTIHEGRRDNNKCDSCG